MNETFTPAQAASALETDSSTVRRWCGWHAAHLSEAASPAPGGRRLLTAHDMEVLRIAGLTTPAINAQLANRTFAVIDGTDTAQASPDAPGAPQLPAVVQNDIAALSTLVAARMEAIERAQAAGDAARRHWLVAFALGALCMAALILIVLGLYWLGG